jgi:hypothetical protein
MPIYMHAHGVLYGIALFSTIVVLGGCVARDLSIMSVMTLTTTEHADMNKAARIHARIAREHAQHGGIFGRHAAWCIANQRAGIEGAARALAVVAHYNRKVG